MSSESLSTESLSSTGAAAVSLPSTPAGRQAAWLLGALTHLPMSQADIGYHFAPTFLAAVPAAKLNTDLQSVGSIRVVSIARSTPTLLVLRAAVKGGRLDVGLGVDATGEIAALRLAPAGTLTGPPPTVPTSWSAVDTTLRATAPRVHLLAAELTAGGCRAIHDVDASTAAPLGSAFKLYVLDALARAVAAGTVRWDQQLTVTEAGKSLPSGRLQNEPVGTRVSVQQAAMLMISISDNTAADLLIGLLGRMAVERDMTAVGTARPDRNIPFPTTRELFSLKFDNWPALAQLYLALDAAGRRQFLADTVDRAALPDVQEVAQAAPRAIDTLEWFASPNDICRLYASLLTLSEKPDLAPVGQILSTNDGDLPLARANWPTIWFKGGSEAGVLTLNYLATNKSGRTYVVSLMAANPAATIPASAIPKLLATAAGALTLATG